MADIKKTVEEVGHKIAETATNVGHKISEGAGKAADWVKEKAHVGECGTQQATCATNIKEHMEVIASCGSRIGKVDHVEGNTIKLTKNDPQASGQHHFIPMDWVARVDSHVHLNKNSRDAMREWKGESCGAM